MSFQLDTESLRAVIVVADLGGVTRAAQALNLTQSAVSHKIKRLEEKIGRPLFARSGRQFNLTVDGQQLLEYARRVVNIHDEAVAQFFRQELSGELRLGTTQGISTSGVAKILSRFSRLYPEVALMTQVDHSPVLKQLLRNGEIDLALVHVFEAELKPEDHILWWDDLLWVEAEDFSGDDYKHLPLITYHRDCFYRAWALDALKKQGRSVRVVLECPYVEGVISGIRSGLGISLINQGDLQSSLRVSRLALPPAPRVAHIARFGSHNPTPQAQALLEAIKGELLPQN